MSDIDENNDGVYTKVLDEDESGLFSDYCKQFCSFEAIVAEWTNIQMMKWQTLNIFMDKCNRKDIINMIYDNLPPEYTVDMAEYNRFKNGKLTSFTPEDQIKMRAVRETYQERYRVAERIFQSMRMIYGTKQNEAYEKGLLMKAVSIMVSLISFKFYSYINFVES